MLAPKMPFYSGWVETHMKKWWEATIKSDDSVTQLACRLQDLGEKCLAAAVPP